MPSREHAMHETEVPDTLLSTTLRQMPAGVVVVAADTGNVVFVNEEVARLTGVRLERGQPFAHHDWSVVRALATGEKVDEEIEVPAAGGRRARLAVSAAPLRDGEGRIVAAVATLFDVTESRRTRAEAIPGENGGASEVEARFHDVDHRRDEFLARLAHDLRNPLAPLRNWLEVLKLHPCEERTVERAREAMVRQVQHLARRVDELLDVSRLTSGSMALLRERLDLAAVLDRALQSSAPLQAHRHDLHVSLPRQPLIVEGDATRLVQVFANLLENAAKYTPEGGRIWLEVEKDGCQAVVRVRDSGAGIPPRLLHRVFELFAQIERGQERSEGGLGIGLTLVRGLVALHGGSVEARSEGLGCGSELVVRLPLAAEPPLREAPPARERALDPSSGLKVLVVEDNLDAAESLSTLLMLYGCEVHTVHDGPSALGAAEAFQPSLVLLDIGLPGMDGFEVARRLRHEPLFLARRLRLVALTGYGSDEDRRQAQGVGFDRYLVKPVDPRELRELLVSAS